MSWVKPRAIAAGRFAASAIAALAAAGALAAPAAPADAAVAPHPGAAADTNSTSQTIWPCRFIGDGIRIHLSPSTTSRVVGLAYHSHVCVMTGFYTSAWGHVTDRTTGVSGWVSTAYLQW